MGYIVNELRGDDVVNKVFSIQANPILWAKALGLNMLLSLKNEKKILVF